MLVTYEKNFTKKLQLVAKQQRRFLGVTAAGSIAIIALFIWEVVIHVAR